MKNAINMLPLHEIYKKGVIKIMQIFVESKFKAF